ncbi:MAG: hypothetical protein OEX07_00190 [Gammaproteobacteria bacterium]|nr:hypothetical protein [Gammaproteobacteria bacterium]
MNHLKLNVLFLLFAVFLSNNVMAATDSYRWLHVTIDTPWAIFLFLLPMVLLPAILMAILYWRFSGKKTKSPEEIENK